MKLQILKELKDTIQEFQQTNIEIRLTNQQYFLYQSNYMAPLYTNYPNCHSHQGQIKIKKHLSFKTQNHNQNFLLSQRHNILFKVTWKNLTFYKWIKANSQMKSQFKINQLNHINLNQQCPVTIVMNSEQDNLYVLSCKGIKRIRTKTALASSFQQIILYQQKHYFYGTLTKVIGDLIFWMSPTQGLKVFGIQLNGNLKELQTINNDSFPNQNLSFKIIDFQFYKEHLFLLTQRQGIYLFKKASNNKFSYLNQIELLPLLLKNNHRILIFENLLFVSINVNNYYFVIQIQIDPLFPQIDFLLFTLLRYYKGFRYISNLEIYMRKLIIFSNRGIQLYPINQDPRKIPFLMNGITNNHLKSTINAKTLKQNLFILNQEEINIIQIQTTNPYIECRFQQGSYQLQVRQLCNQFKKRRYFEHCQKYDKLNVNVNDSSNSWWIFLVVSSIIIVNACICGLIYWRKKKQITIQRIIGEIYNFQIKKMTKIQFFQSQQDHKTKSEDFNQFKDQISLDSSPKQKDQQIEDVKNHPQNQG